MVNFYEGLPPAVAMKLQEKYSAMEQLKDERAAIFRYFAVSTAEELKERIRLKEVADDKAANEAYQDILAINNEIEAVRDECMKIMREG